jgi:hypothetical protein
MKSMTCGIKVELLEEVDFIAKLGCSSPHFKRKIVGCGVAWDIFGNPLKTWKEQ